MPIIIKRVFMALIIAAAVFFVISAFSSDSEDFTTDGVVYRDEGIFIAELGIKHIELGDPHPPYNSVPPTSGWHVEVPADWGIYQEPLPDEILVHNLEHGGIVIHYRPDLDTATVRKLEAIGEQYKKRTIVIPNTAIEKNIENKIRKKANPICRVN